MQDKAFRLGESPITIALLSFFTFHKRERKTFMKLFEIALICQDAGRGLVLTCTQTTCFGKTR